MNGTRMGMIIAAGSLIALPVMAGDEIIVHHEHDFIGGRASEENTGVSEARTADDFAIEKAYSLTHLVATFLVDPNAPLQDWRLELWNHDGDSPVEDGPFHTVKGGIATATGDTNFGFNVVEVDFDLTGPILLPGDYWVVVQGIGNGNGRAFWTTANANPGDRLDGSDIMLKSTFFWYPEWTLWEKLIGSPSDVAFTLQGEPVDPLEITDIAITFGTLLSGNVDTLSESDDVHLQTRSATGFNAQEPNRTDLVVGIESDSQSPIEMAAVIESRINHPVGIAKVSLRDWASDLFEEIDVYDIGTEEETHTISAIDAADHVRESDGRIELRVRHVVMATFTASGFRSFFDHVGVWVD